ncbi:MAG TPA: hypothetical protein VLL05_12395, partial [Terriglobales bacterium]|nr:hypothetical protein [Terriglobales bacterium]
MNVVDTSFCRIRHITIVTAFNNMAQVSTQPTGDAASGNTMPAPSRLGLNPLDRIGNTPLLRLGRIAGDVPGVEILGKAE